MGALINLHPVKFVGKAVQIRRRNQRMYTAQYHLDVGTKRHNVCLKAFIGILGVGSKQVKNLNTFSWANPGGTLVPDDGRGKHSSRPNRIPASVVAQIDRATSRPFHVMIVITALTRTTSIFPPI